MELAELVSSIANAENAQTAAWMRLLWLEDRLSRARRKYISGRLEKPEWLFLAESIELDWQDTHRQWVDARDMAKEHVREMESILFGVGA